MMGWKCPGCGACYSPIVTKCSVCGPKATPNPWHPPNLPPLSREATIRGLELMGVADPERWVKP